MKDIEKAPDRCRSGAINDLYRRKSQIPTLPPISVTSPPSVTSWLNMTSRCGGCWLKKVVVKKDGFLKFVFTNGMEVVI